MSLTPNKSKFLNNDFKKFDDEDEDNDNVFDSFLESTKPRNINKNMFPGSFTYSQPKTQKYPPKITSSLNGIFYVPFSQSQNQKNFPYSLLQKQITNNMDLISNETNLTSFYFNSTILTFFNIFKQHENNDLILDKYTQILNEYIQSLNEKIQSLQEKQNKMNDLLIKRFQEEIFTFELVKILFLKPGNIDKEYDHHILLKNPRKYLTELLIRNLHKKCDETLQRTSNAKDQIKHYIIHGQIQTAIEKSKQYNFPYIAIMLSKLIYPNILEQKEQQLNNKSNNNVPMQIPGQEIYKLFWHYNLNNNKDNKKDNNNINTESECILIGNSMTWKNVLIQLLIFTYEQNIPLHQILPVFKSHCEKMNLFTKDKYKTDINFQLLMLFSSIENKELNEHREMIKYISSSQNIFHNIINTNLSHPDHHIQYIISLILLEIHNQTNIKQNTKLWDSNLLRDIHGKLLNKFIEECLSIKEANIIEIISSFIEQLPITFELKQKINQYINVSNNK